MSSESAGVVHSSFENSAIAYLLIPDILLPEQYADLRRTVRRSPEQMLYLSILEDAIDCWLRGKRAGQSYLATKEVAEAESWIWGDGGTVSFEMCCQMLDILPDWLRGKLNEIRPQRPMKVKPIRHQVRRGPDIQADQNGDGVVNE